MTRYFCAQKQEGITLIALVITIIILLILAGVAIVSLTGENGILNRSIKANEKYSISQAEEKINLEILNLQSEILLKENREMILEDIIDLEGNGITVRKNGEDLYTEVDESNGQIYALISYENYEFKIYSNYELAYCDTKMQPTISLSSITLEKRQYRKDNME